MVISTVGWQIKFLLAEQQPPEKAAELTTLPSSINFTLREDNSNHNKLLYTKKNL